jgi:hypothetical protein
MPAPVKKRERDEKQLATAQPVREPAEPERAEYGAGDVSAAGETHVRVGETQRRARLERARDRPGKRHFESVEQPCHA